MEARIVPGMTLTLKQQLFAHEYLVDLNASGRRSGPASARKRRHRKGGAC
jgi:hypothetical protein